MPKYVLASNGGRLHQGEILTDLIQTRQSLDSIGTEMPKLDEIVHPFVVVLSQDCDLEQDFAAREAGSFKLENVLVCPAAEVSDLKATIKLSKDLWKLITQNREVRYQCIEEAPADKDLMGIGIPCLAFDFKDYFTIPTDELMKRIKVEQVRRRARLEKPYAEHLLHRFCNFQARIPLPESHEIPL